MTSGARASGAANGNGNGNTDGCGCIAVVGMHRSGTSAMAGLLIGLGLAGPRGDDLVPASESNERGHWESQTVHLCNARVLAARGATTYAPPQPSSDWESDVSLDAVRADAGQWFAATAGDTPLVLKDPRLCVTLPFWKKVIPSRLAAVLMLRDPLEVACSLQARDDLPVLLGLALWDRYLRSAVQDLEGLPVLVVDYRVMLADPLASCDAVCEFLKAIGVHIDPARRDRAPDLVDDGLRHQRSGPSGYEPLVGAQRQVLDLLTEREGAHAAWKAPLLPPAPPWVDDVLALRRELAVARHELHWTKTSRVFRAASAVWRVTGHGPSRLPVLHEATDDGSDR